MNRENEMLRTLQFKSKTMTESVNDLLLPPVGFVVSVSRKTFSSHSTLTGKTFNMFLCLFIRQKKYVKMIFYRDIDI